MKQPQQAPPNGVGASTQESCPNEEKRRPSLRSTAEILARGVSLAQVEEAVKRLRPQVHRVG
ncbi:MAG TPA: hypothetical protein VNT01_06650 [Symbiobacteriaceae bacterium]|nr:hypothetical protein [Symbiobacteriaceae bacterium]